MSARSLRQAGWNFLGNGEKVTSRLVLSSLPSRNEDEIRAPMIHLNYSNVDHDTRTRELARHYIEFANSVANDTDFIHFTPEEHSANERWGSVDMLVNVVYQPEAVEALLRLDPGLIWQDFSADPSLHLNPVARVRMHAVFNRLKAAQQETTRGGQLEQLVLALRAATWKQGIVNTSLNGRILGIINRLVEANGGRGKIFIGAVGSNSADVENTMPGRLSLYGARGRGSERTEDWVLFGDGTPAELWEAL
jgi:hypothetical protein